MEEGKGLKGVPDGAVKFLCVRTGPLVLCRGLLCPTLSFLSSVSQHPCDEKPGWTGCALLLSQPDRMTH